MAIYKFASSADMTPQEVADIMKVVIVSLLQAIQQRTPDGNEPLEIDQAIYDNLPIELKKFFTESTTTP